MPNYVGIECQCGGKVNRLLNDNIFFTVAEDNTIVFRGLCEVCDEVTTVEKDIIVLLTLSESKDLTLN